MTRTKQDLLDRIDELEADVVALEEEKRELERELRTKENAELSQYA